MCGYRVALLPRLMHAATCNKHTRGTAPGGKIVQHNRYDSGTISLYKMLRHPENNLAMESVTIRCHAELNDFLLRERQHTTFTVPCAEHASIKNLVEAAGVPHPEVGMLLVNGAPVDFTYMVRPGDAIEVYPCTAEPVPASLLLRPPLTALRFILDTHLGRLAAYLRMLGFDTLYRNDFDDPELARLAHDESRILLTRDLGLLKRSLVIYGYFVREIVPENQLREVVQRFRLAEAVASFERCTRCNGLVQPVEKAQIDHLLEPRTRQFYDIFHQCQTCGQIYWQGSHFVHMQSVIERVLQARGGE